MVSMSEINLSNHKKDGVTLIVLVVYNLVLFYL
jgi:hypothetical protein